ncbi:MAG: VWA domain-containing protein, partial [bacterium]|nr:VWA domain-containing protein [bacterium]
MKSLEEAVEIANPENPHCPVLLLLDTSGSMSGEKIQQLNEGIKIFKKQVQEDDIASKRVDVAVIAFDSNVKVIHEFSSIEDFEPQELEASGSTNMGEAILTGIDLVEKRKNQYKQKGIDYYRPWIVLITDGAPTDMSEGDEKWQQVISKVHS